MNTIGLKSSAVVYPHLWVCWAVKCKSIYDCWTGLLLVFSGLLVFTPDTVVIHEDSTSLSFYQQVDRTRPRYPPSFQLSTKQMCVVSFIQHHDTKCVCCAEFYIIG